MTFNQIATMNEIEISKMLRAMTRKELIAFCKENEIENINKLGGHLHAAFLWCKEVIAFARITLR